MSEYEIVGLVFVGLAGIVSLGVLIGRPLVKAVKAITELTISVKILTQKFETFELTNHDAHKRMWEKNEAQDKTLADHDRRIERLEGGL